MWLTIVCAVLAIAGMLAYALVPWLLLAPVVWLHARIYVRHTRWALSRDALYFRRGAWTRRTSILPRARIQAVDVVASPFDRRSRMAGVVVDTAGASSGSNIVRVPYLEVETARELAARLYESAAYPAHVEAVSS